MDQKWMAMLGAAGFIAMMLGSAFAMDHFENLRQKRRRRNPEERGTSATPPPARH
ncbi:MAG TPA: hypothetical protein VFP80_03325 [Thermoanaerobaculia bacterium]|nr:hypothetical protein [Thermoanaerobaculia bacterium]